MSNNAELEAKGYSCMFWFSIAMLAFMLCFKGCQEAKEDLHRYDAAYEQGYKAGQSEGR